MGYLREFLLKEFRRKTSQYLYFHVRMDFSSGGRQGIFTYDCPNRGWISTLQKFIFCGEQFLQIFLSRYTYRGVPKQVSFVYMSMLITPFVEKLRLER